MKIVSSKTREQFPLSYKKITKKTIESTIRYSVFLILVLLIIVSYSFAPPDSDLISNLLQNLLKQTLFQRIGIIIGIFLITIFLIALLSYFYQRWYFAVYFYELTPDFIIIRKGPIIPKEITIPYERVQDIYIDQDLLDRIFGLYDVHLSTATISSAIEAHIDGLEKEAAEGLKNILVETVQQKINKIKNN